MKCLHCKHALQGSAWVCDDGVVVHTHCQKPYENAKAKRTHKCPVCSGAGEIEDQNRPIRKRVKVETPDCAYGGCRGCIDCIEGQMTTVGFKKKPCDLCSGWGYLTKEPKPITKVVGWEV